MDQKHYKAAKEGNVSCLSEEAMNNEQGIFLQRTQHSNNNILHIAARAGRDTFVAEALRRFPLLSDQANSQGDTPLLVAARFGHFKVVKTLAVTARENEANSIEWWPELRRFGRRASWSSIRCANSLPLAGDKFGSCYSYYSSI
ncbi:hypothetical protein RHSIM_Rhsim04G0028800 [Rhododendron simsii]|uniref:Uncharacterized protein n=1 Tax=Rhododendron simsii TaxID=118357 RepID=A0A834HE72_RHOSS|nr:hypothetical protein RHSIM_Rhsim04G0028800 [Rhododendron simsii]